MVRCTISESKVKTHGRDISDKVSIVHSFTLNMVKEPRRIIGIVNIINFNDNNGIFQNLHSQRIYTRHIIDQAYGTGEWRRPQHGRVEPVPESGAGTGERRGHGIMGERRRHMRSAPVRENGRVALVRENGRVAPVRESGAGRCTGEWRRYRRVAPAR